MEASPPVDAMMNRETSVLGKDEGLLKERGDSMQGNLLVDVPAIPIGDGKGDSLAVQDSGVNALQGLGLQRVRKGANIPDGLPRHHP